MFFPFDSLDNLTSPLGLTVVTVSLILLYFLFIWENRMDKMLRKFPGPTGVPILGNVLSLINPSATITKSLEWRNKYGHRFTVRVGLYRHVTVTDPADVEKVLTSHALLEKGQVYSAIRPWLGTGLLINKDEKWQARRKLINPAFHTQVLDSFLPSFNENAQILVDVMRTKGVNGNLVQIDTPMTRCALDIICDTAMGVKCNIQTTGNDNYWKASVKQTQLIFERWGRPWLNFEFTWSLSGFGREDKVNRKILHDFRDRIIREKKTQLEREKQMKIFSAPQLIDSINNLDDRQTKPKLALLDLLLNIQASGGGLTDQDIREEVDTILFEGHDNTAVSLTWTTFILALYPEHQATVHAELDSIFGDDRQRPVTQDDLSRMNFLSCCVKESLRLFPTVPVISRQINEDFLLADSAIVPQGANVSVPIILIHRNKEIFPNPEEFQPSRFFPENSTGRHPYSYVPFSHGPRNCIGQRFGYIQLKTVLAHLFRNFRIETVDTRQSVVLTPQIILRPKEEIRVRLFPR